VFYSYKTGAQCPCLFSWPHQPRDRHVPTQLPLLSAINWIALPITALGVARGALSSKNGGRNFCLVVLLIAVVRLILGGGIV